MIPIGIAMLATFACFMGGFAVGQIVEGRYVNTTMNKRLRIALDDAERELMLFQASILLATAVPNFEMFNGEDIVDPDILDMRREMARSLFRMSAPVREYVPVEGDTVALDAVASVIDKIEEIMLLTTDASVH